MKVKFGDMTVRQLADMCNSHDFCEGCPFSKDGFTMRCKMSLESTKLYLDFKVDLPDEEVKEDA